MEQQIIAFSGQLRNGKDVAADYLKSCAVIPLGFERYAFANAVKDIFCMAFGESREFIEEWKVQSEPPPGYLKRVRESLQFIGDGFRTIKGSVWIDMALDRHEKMILSDARYINELEAVHSRGGINILIYRPGYLNNDPNGSEAQIRPLIEWCIDTYQKDGPINYLMGRTQSPTGKKPPYGMEFIDVFIINDGTLEDLYEKIDEHVLPILRRKEWIN